MSTTTRNKGNNIIDFPADYIVFDLETTGLVPEWDSIIEIGAIHYANGYELDRFQTLVKPEWGIPEFITELTGITNEMVADAPSIEDSLPSFVEYIGDKILVGHNVNFDVNFVYDNWKTQTGTDFQNDFIDTMRIARKLLNTLPHHRLKDLKKYYGITVETEHRAIADCIATQMLFEHLHSGVFETYGSDDAFRTLFKKKYSRGYDVNNIAPTGEDDFDPDNLLFGKEVVITGTLERMLRKDALQLIANIGGIPKDSVTKKTNFLILGNNDYCKTIKGDKSSKQVKAEKLKLEGNDIEILSEDVFYDLLGINE